MNKTNKKITKPKDTITETKGSKRVQGKIWSVVLEEANKKRNTGITEKDLKKRLRFMALSWNVRFWFILHDNDYDENGEKERLHYHILLFFPRKQDKTALLKRLPFMLDCDVDMIGLDKITSLASQLRYLIHLDEIEGKYRYDPQLVQSNDTATFLDAVSVDDVEDVTTQSIITAVAECGNDPQALARRLGAGNYCKYRFLIKDLLSFGVYTKRQRF